MDKVFFAKKYLYHNIIANIKHHSSDAYINEILTNCFIYKDRNSDFQEIEKIRKQLSKNNKQIKIEDFGARKDDYTSERSIKKIAKNALMPAWYAQLIYRIARFKKPKVILELGTSLGITTAYLAKACPDAKIISIEGSKEIHRIANENFQQLGLKNIESINAPFDEILPKILLENPHIDFIFVDGNHTYEATVRYYNQINKNTQNDSVLIFDDIHWSKGMFNAWQEIIKNENSATIINIFAMGIILKQKEKKTTYELLKY